MSLKAQSGELKDDGMIEALDISKSYEDGAIQVLRGVSLTVARGETVALCGPSGCGKSTLLHLIGGLDTPDSGKIAVARKELASGNRALDLLRHEVGFVFQLHNLLPDLTLTENCLIPTVAAGTKRTVAEKRLSELAERMGLGHRLNARIQKLSGGERQRTAICRALMNSPRILLADEPTGSLDEKTAETVFRLLLELASSEGLTLLMATHDRALAARCDRMVEMRDGRIVEGVRNAGK
ncbi:ABC transporter ATP-binding protein [Telmatobacter bradus]|uniref:ABC transporter ATP-binding protein n=1 Tax=Telmatobacter bradus TaxID=474953 RepID=UPI003B429C63